jgi:hypothetical protein
MIRCTVFHAVLVLLVLSAGITPLSAEWIENGAAVCREGFDQIECAAASDGAGGSIIVWKDERDNSAPKIYAQRIDAYGNALWTSDGMPVCVFAGSQINPQTVSDGSGGAIIAWSDTRDGTWSVYAQRIDADGALQWGAIGITICTAVYHQDNIAMVPDGSGGALITWRDIRNNFDYDIYSQKVNSAGVVQWTADGVACCAISGNQQGPQIVTDNTGGAIVTWYDNRFSDNDIYAQRVNAAGSVQWASNGIAVCSATNHQQSPQIIDTPSGGAIIVWDDWRKGTDADIYIQKLDASGTVQWSPADGIAICNLSEDQYTPRLVADGGGGAIIAWSDRRNATDFDIYAQWIYSDGSNQWTYRGIPICTETNHQYMEYAVSDGSNGMILIWKDLRGGSDYDLYTQRLNLYGEILWTSTGVAVTITPEPQTDATAVQDGDGGVIVAWEDGRNGVYFDIFAQRIDQDGYWGYPAPVITSVRDVPQDQGGSINLAWNASQYDPTGGITEYTIWRALDTGQAAIMMAGGALMMTDDAKLPRALDCSVIRTEMLNGAPYYWEMIDSHDAYSIDTYSSIVASPFDSTSSSNEYQYFQIIAHSPTPSTFWVSGPDSGYSVDNLAPCPPLALAGEQQYSPEGLLLTWTRNTEPDLDCYRVYRGTSESFEPGPGNLLGAPCDTTTLDGSWSWEAGYWYKVAAVDIHGNESIYAVLGPDAVTGDDPMPVPDATFLSQNWPNPFNPITNIRFGIKEPAHVSIRIYDAAGRHVTTLIDENRPAGRYDTVWDGTDGSGSTVASGVYFYRLKAGPFEETKKMILLR